MNSFHTRGGGGSGRNPHFFVCFLPFLTANFPEIFHTVGGGDGGGVCIWTLTRILHPGGVEKNHTLFFWKVSVREGCYVEVHCLT